jgi:hypothetical protein
VFVHDRQTGHHARERVEQRRAGDGLRHRDGTERGRPVRRLHLAGGEPRARDTNGQFDVFVRDRQAGTTRRVSVSAAGTQGDGQSSEPSLSADGRYLAFSSRATTLAPGEDRTRPSTCSCAT